MLYNDLKEDIFSLHENPECIEPFAKAFARAGVSFSEILLTSGGIDPTQKNTAEPFLLGLRAMVEWW